MTHMDVVCVDTLITGATEYQVIDHLREQKRGTMRNLTLTELILSTHQM